MTIRIVEEIGSPETRGESVTSAYEPLTKPLPLRGANVESAVLRTALLLEFPHFADAIVHVVDDLALRRWVGLTSVHLRPPQWSEPAPMDFVSHASP